MQQHSFSFNGMRIEKLGLQYLPNLSDVPVLLHGEHSFSEQLIEAHDGGYYYGLTVQPKIFTLRCFFQESNIQYGILNRVQQFFARGKTGKLVFSDNDWLWYMATVQDVAIENLVNTESGLIDISLKCYYPFARHDGIFATDAQLREKNIVQSSGLLSEKMTPVTSVTEEISDEKELLLYNGGSERASVAIKIQASAPDGEVKVYNESTDQSWCFRKFETTGSQYYLSDALNGKTIYYDGTSSSLDFLHHFGGYIELIPGTPVYRKLNVTLSSGSTSVKGADCFNDDMVGQYITIGKDDDGNYIWSQITACTDENNIVIETASTENTSIKATIASMNKIKISCSGGAVVSNIEFIYKPTFK